MKNNRLFMPLACLLLFFIACKKESPQTPQPAATGITSVFAGKGPLDLQTERGFLTNENLNISPPLPLRYRNHKLS